MLLFLLNPIVFRILDLVSVHGSGVYFLLGNIINIPKF